MIPIAKKRKNGEGTLRLRKDGRWEGRIVVGYNEKSLPITKCVTAKTKTECSAKLEALKEQYGRSSDKIKPDMPFGDWIDFWYQTYCRHTLRITTRTDYENRIFNHIIPEIGKIPLNRLSQSDLQQFYAKEKTDGRKLHAKTYGKGLSDRTIRGIHANCRTALQRAVQEGLIRTNPAVGCKLPPKKAREMQVLTQNEIIRFLHQAKEEGCYELFLLELSTGMRRGDDDDKIRLNQRKPSKYKGLRRFGPEKNLQRINKFMKERPIFYKNLIQMKENFRFYLRCFYCIAKVVILQFNSENRTELARNG